ncbi:ribonuclease HI family protein [Virgibacillus xinjiangensis]|uniref:Ribonuclease HI family protein n=1 Tax=Virgibacillus xinjiangensis TaxID=393090 RepID=A0ABV7CYU8_9BACI
MIEVYTDGASSGDPGKSGAGIYIKKAGQAYEYSYPLGNLSNHEAEFLAVLKALEVCQADFPDDILSFRSDSKLVVEAVERNYVRSEKYAPLLQRINEVSAFFPYFFIKWIPEKQNKHADQLAKKGIQLNDSSN